MPIHTSGMQCPLHAVARSKQQGNKRLPHSKTLRAVAYCSAALCSSSSLRFKPNELYLTSRGIRVSPNA